jgi:hypothetical protein
MLLKQLQTIIVIGIFVIKIMDIKEISKEIIQIKFEGSDTLDDCMNKFYDVMRKHGIKQNTPSENGVGVIGSNFEWTMCKVLFIDMVVQHFTLKDFFNGVPKDLHCYEK